VITHNKLEDFTSLYNKTLTKIEVFNTDVMAFHVEYDDVLVLSHNQDCCERVFIESITGDLKEDTDDVYVHKRLGEII